MAVTSIDGGALKLTAQERSRGWWTAENRRFFHYSFKEGREDRDDWIIAYSPVLESVEQLPQETHDECCEGFDECYVFDREPPDSDLEVFVNWMGFRLDDPEFQWAIDRFWNQMATLEPESYIADGTVFTFATRNRDLFEAVLSAFGKDLNTRD
jgi:hypothetical protein